MTRLLVLAIVCATAACGGGTPAPPDAPPPPWSEGPALPGPRLEPGVTAIGDQLVVLGGFDQSVEQGLGITSDVDVLDTGVTPSSGSGSAAWTQLASAPVAWTHIQLAASGQILYLLGGLEGQNYVAQGSAFALDTSTGSAAWRALAPLPAGFERGSAAVIVALPRIYLLGGAGTTSALASNLYYDVIMDAWCPGAACAGSAADQQLPDLPAPRSHPAGMRLADGTLVVVGGLATLDSTQPQSDVWWLPIDQQNTSGQWVTKTPMPTARGGCAYGTIGTRLVCAGGEAGLDALHVAELYDPALDPDPSPNGSAWAALPDMPRERAGAQGAAIGQRLFIPGGAQLLQYEPLATLLELDLDYVPPPVGP